MKKALAFIIILILAASAAACDGKSSETSSDNSFADTSQNNFQSDLAQKLIAHTWTSHKFAGDDPGKGDIVYEFSENGKIVSSDKWKAALYNNDNKEYNEIKTLGTWSVSGSELTIKITEKTLYYNGTEVEHYIYEEPDTSTRKFDDELKDEMIREWTDTVFTYYDLTKLYDKPETWYVSDKWFVLDGNMIYKPK